MTFRGVGNIISNLDVYFALAPDVDELDGTLVDVPEEDAEPPDVVDEDIGTGPPLRKVSARIRTKGSRYKPRYRRNTFNDSVIDA